VRLLGGFEVLRGAEILEGFESKKVRALFAYLLLNRAQPLGRDRLAGLLWPEHSEEASRQNLRQAIYNLRTTLEGAIGGEALVATQLHLQMTPALPLWLDVEAFERSAQSGVGGDGESAAEALRQAAALYRGDLLAGFYVKESDLFEDWLAGERERLRETAAAATRALIVHHESRGEWDEGIRTARRLAQVDPLSEEAYRHLMRCFAFSGRRARALAQYEELKKLLDSELGVEPSQETIDFHRALLAEEAGDLEPSRISTPPGPYIPLIGREEAMARLHARWAEVLKGQVRLTLVEGERGSGKTRLLRTFIHAAASESGAVVLQSRSHELAAHGLEPLLDALASLPADSAAAAPERREPAARGVVTAKQLAERLRAIVRPTGSGKPQPLIMLIDDLECAGRLGLAALADLLPLVADLPIYILTAARYEEIDADHPLASLLPRLDAFEETTRLRIGRLDDGAPLKVAEALVSDPATAKRVAKFLAPTAGLPLTLAEGVNLLADEGTLEPRPDGEGLVMRDRRKTPLPQTLQEIVLRRVAMLPTTSRRLLTLAAVIGERFDSALLQIADREHPAVIEAGLEILIARWFIRPAVTCWVTRRERDLVLWSGGARRGAFEFAQRAVRALVYHHIDPARRRNMHRRIALSIEHLAGGGVPPAGLLGHHFAQAGDWPRAAPYLKSAGDAAAAAGDNELAAHHYARALQALQHLDRADALELPELGALRREMEGLLSGLAPRRGRRRPPSDAASRN
jgi:DNA-binding SARP family transcriptional activator